MCVELRLVIAMKLNCVQATANIVPPTDFATGFRATRVPLAVLLIGYCSNCLTCVLSDGYCYEGRCTSRTLQCEQQCGVHDSNCVRLTGGSSSAGLIELCEGETASCKNIMCFADDFDEKEMVINLTVRNLSNVLNSATNRNKAVQHAANEQNHCFLPSQKWNQGKLCTLTTHN